MDTESLVTFGEQLKVYKSADGQQGIVEALGVRFSDPASPDLEDDYFDDSTYFGKRAGDGVDATLNHRIPIETKSEAVNAALKSMKGMIFTHPVKSTKTDWGLVGRHVLELANEYEAFVFDMAEKGAFRWSTGTSPHLIDKETNGKSNHIKRWDINEWAYTPTAADPNLPRIAPLKSLAAAHPDLKVLLPEVDSLGDEEGDVTGAKQIETQGDIQMSEEKQEAEAVPAPAVDLSPILDAIKGVDDKVNGISERVEKIEKTPKNDPGIAAPAVLEHGKGDSFAKSMKVWLKTGDSGTFDRGVVHDNRLTIKASNATDMNIGTDADGGYAVPTGHYDNIIARRDEVSVTPGLGLQPIMGVGTTVNVPIDNEADGEFVSTAEAGTFDLDAPALNTVAMTLVKYTKKIQLSYELLQDEESNLMSFIENWVGRGYGKTLDQLLLAEVATNGSTWDTFASATVIAVGEPENLVSNADLGGYLDDNNSVAFVMNHSTFWEIKSLRSANFNNYSDYPAGEGTVPTLLGFPVKKSMKAASTVASAVSVYFGNWAYVGWRQSPSLTFLRNPYLLADSGQDVLHYYFRTDFGVLQSEAIGFGDHPSA